MSFNIVTRLPALFREVKEYLGTLVLVKGKLLCVLTILQIFILLHRFFIIDVYYTCVASYDSSVEITGGTIPRMCMTLSGYGFLKRNNELLVALAFLHCLLDSIFMTFLTVGKINVLLALFVFKGVLCLRYVYFTIDFYNCMLGKSIGNEIVSIYNYNNTCLFVYPLRFQCVIGTEIINFGRAERYVCYNSDYETLNYYIIINLCIHIFGLFLYIFYILRVICSKLLDYFKKLFNCI